MYQNMTFINDRRWKRPKTGPSNNHETCTFCTIYSSTSRDLPKINGLGNKLRIIELKKKDQPRIVKYGDKQENAFSELKDLLTNAPVNSKNLPVNS